MGAAGLVAGWSGIESSGGPASINPKSHAVGIGQWLDRALAFYAWAKANGPNPSDYDAQLGFVVHELNGSEAKAGAALRGAKTMGDVARGASTYERAEGYNAVTGVDNYTSSTPVGKILKMLHGSGSAMPHRPVSHTPLSTMSALHPVTTASTSNSMHIDQIHVNAPNATNAHGIASRITDALRQTAMTTNANFGQA